MGIEIESKYNGTESNFMTAILVIEEISKIDPAVAVMVDIHNTLVNNLFRKLGTEEQKNKYLPLLASKWVRKSVPFSAESYSFLVIRRFQVFA